MSVDMQKAMESYMAEIKEDGTYEYVDNEFEVTEPIQEETQQEQQTVTENTEDNSTNEDDPFLQK